MNVIAISKYFHIFSLTGKAVWSFLLCDTLRNSPVIVTYDSWLPYAIEGFIVVLFFFGTICSHRSKFFLMAASGVAFPLPTYCAPSKAEHYSPPASPCCSSSFISMPTT